MAVRVKLRVRSRASDKAVETAALVNSGFETLKPQLLLPVKMAEELGLWPDLSKKSHVKEYVTAGGTIKNYVIPDSIEVSIVLNDERSSEASSDAVISPIEDEILIGDKLAGRLGIQVFDFGEGVWKLNTDSPNIRRRSEPPQYWT